VKRWLNENSLSIFFFALLLLALLGQSIAGWKDFNEDAATHHSQLLSYTRYLVSSDFGEGVMENWQSEFLQFSTFILATIWLLQKGSNESKSLDDQGLESDQKQRMKSFAEPGSPLWAKVGGLRTALYANSLLIVMTAVFLLTWLAQSLTGWNQYNDDQQEHDLAPVAWATYVTRPDFWSNTFENWQSEFLAVGTMAVFTIYLRQRGSPESKPVGAPHDETASSG